MRLYRDKTWCLELLYPCRMMFWCNVTCHYGTWCNGKAYPPLWRAGVQILSRVDHAFNPYKQPIATRTPFRKIKIIISKFNLRVQPVCLVDQPVFQANHLNCWVKCATGSSKTCMLVVLVKLVQEAENIAFNVRKLMSGILLLFIGFQTA